MADNQAAAKTEIEAPSEASAARWPLSLFVSQSITTGGLKQAAFCSLDFKHKSKRKKNLRKRAGEEAATTALGGRDTDEAVWCQTGDCGSAPEYFWKFFVCPSTVPRTYGFGNIFHHNCPHLQHGINIPRFADIWAQFDTRRAVVVQLRVRDKKAVSGPRGGI